MTEIGAPTVAISAYRRWPLPQQLLVTPQRLIAGLSMYYESNACQPRNYANLHR